MTDFYRSILDAMDDGILILNRDGKVLFHNQSFIRIWKIPPPPAEQNDHMLLVNAAMERLKAPEPFISIITGLFDSPEERFSGSVAMKDGNFLHVMSLPCNDNEQGKARLWRFTDVTEQTGREEALRKSEERFRRLIGNARDMIYRMLVPEGIYEFVSNSAEAITGYSPEEFYKNPLLIKRVIHPQWLEYMREQWRNLLNGHAPPFYEYQIVTPRGETRWIHQKNALVYDEEGNLEAIEGIVADISDRRTAEEELRNALDRADAANRTKSAFLVSMSHEIRTPMNGILGTIELLLGTALSDEQREYLTFAKISSQNLLSLLSNILDLARIEAGKLEIRERTFSLSDTVSALITLLERQAQKKGVKVACTIDPELPDSLCGDQQRFGQILMNLISNALKFTDEGSIDVSLNVMRQEGDQFIVLCSVKDTGPGVPAERKDSIFEPFVQGYNMPYTEGAGLGLSICREIVTLMGGSIWLESASGLGSAFYFTAPMRRGMVIEKSLLRLPVKARPLSIIIAEDEVINRRVIVDYLAKRGHRIKAAKDGAGVINALNEGTFDLILMDINMKGMDGVQATRVIRGREKETGGHIPIIALTAYAMVDDRERFLQEGMDDYLPKPVDFYMLDEIILRATGSNYNPAV